MKRAIQQRPVRTYHGLHQSYRRSRCHHLRRSFLGYTCRCCTRTGCKNTYLRAGRVAYAQPGDPSPDGARVIVRSTSDAKHTQRHRVTIQRVAYRQSGLAPGPAAGPPTPTDCSAWTGPPRSRAPAAVQASPALRQRTPRSKNTQLAALAFGAECGRTETEPQLSVTGVTPFAINAPCTWQPPSERSAGSPDL